MPSAWPRVLRIIFGVYLVGWLVGTGQLLVAWDLQGPGDPYALYVLGAWTLMGGAIVAGLRGQRRSFGTWVLVSSLFNLAFTFGFAVDSFETLIVQAERASAACAAWNLSALLANAGFAGYVLFAEFATGRRIAP